MDGRSEAPATGGWTRARAVRAAAGGGVLLGAVALGAGRVRTSTSAAAPSPRQDARILDALLVLERVQEAFYRDALRRGRLRGELREFAEVAGTQETEHVRLLTARLGGRASAPPTTDFGDATEREDRFGELAIELEEATIGAYIGQGANLTRREVAEVAKIVAVEARQAAWIRDIAGEDPAPHAADPAGDPARALDGLRDRGILR